MHLLLVFSLLLVLPFAAHCQQEVPCPVPTGRESCVCDTGNGIIDLTSMSNRDGTPFFKEQSDTVGIYQYYYNPCCGFLLPNFSECSFGDVGVCQINPRFLEDSYNCGASGTEQIVRRGAYFYVQYRYGTFDRASEVRLICDPTAEEPILIPYSDLLRPLFYEFDLKTKCACPGMCANQATPSTDQAAQL